MEATNGLAAGAVQELRAALSGNVLLPGDAGFDKALLVWAVSPLHKTANVPSPALVVQPRGTCDVVAAVKFASAHGLELAVKGGGHGGGNPSCVPGGLMLDMSLMRSVYVDPKERTAVVDGGCLACDLDSETALCGLAAPLGVCVVVGMGLALNGGVSLLGRVAGPTCDNLLEVQLVMADGSVVTASKDGDPELFWAVRGAGSLLGVATKLKFKLHDVSGAYCGALIWKDDPGHGTFRALLRWLRDVVLPNPSIGYNLARTIHPELGPVLISMVALLGDEPAEEKAALLKPLRDLGPIVDTVGKSSWHQTQSTYKEGVTGVLTAFPVHYESWVGGHVTADKLTDECIDTLVRCFADDVPLPECGLTMAVFEVLGGKLRESTSPVGGIKAGDLQWVVQAGWHDPAASPKGVAYTTGVRAAMQSLTSGFEGYINMVDTQAGAMSYAEAAAKAGSPAELERLRAVKERYDPGKMFRHCAWAKALAAQP